MWRQWGDITPAGRVRAPACKTEYSRAGPRVAKGEFRGLTTGCGPNRGNLPSSSEFPVAIHRARGVTCYLPHGDVACEEVSGQRMAGPALPRQGGFARLEGLSRAVRSVKGRVPTGVGD